MKAGIWACLLAVFWASTSVSAPPTIPAKLEPLDGDSVWQAAPLLKVFRSTDPDGDSIKYRYEVYADAGMSSLLRVWTTREAFAYVYPELPNDLTSYWWRVRAFGATDSSAWTSATQFVTKFQGWGNGIHVESRRFNPSQISCTVAVRISNEDHIYLLHLPLEMRTLSGAAFTAPGSLSGLSSFEGRIHNSPIGEGNDEHSLWPVFGDEEIYWRGVPTTNTCSGPVSNTYPSGTSPGGLFVSPDMAAYFCNSLGDPNIGELIFLPPGRDGSARADASLLFVFNASVASGTFIMDTGCFQNFGHLTFHNDSGNYIVPQFTPGIITIAPCACDCHADPECDGSHNVLDVIQVGNRAFRGFGPTVDPEC